jgi:hypothetical protein
MGWINYFGTLNKGEKIHYSCQNSHRSGVEAQNGYTANKYIYKKLYRGFHNFNHRFSPFTIAFISGGGFSTPLQPNIRGLKIFNPYEGGLLQTIRTENL